MSAAADTAHAEAVAALLEHFPPNPRKHGRFLGVNDRGQKVAETYEGQAVTAALLLEHLTAPHTALARARRLYAVGYLAGSEAGTDVGALDLDGEKFPEPGALDEARARTLAAAERLGLKVYPERSSRGNGWHVWTFADAELTWAEMRLALRALRRAANLPPSAETYPAGEDAGSTWIGTPYAGALEHPQRLGRTYLETPEGQGIPVDELGEYVVRSSAATLRELAATEARRQPSYGNGKPADLEPATADALIAGMTGAKPAHRHFAVAAFLNCGRRAGRLGDMAEALKRAEVWRAWVDDNSRSLAEWADEVESWAEWIAEHPDRDGRGLKYLKADGFALPPSVRRSSQEPPRLDPDADPTAPEDDDADPNRPDFWTLRNAAGEAWRDETGDALRLSIPAPYEPDERGAIYQAVAGKPPRLIAPRALAVVSEGEDADSGEGVALVRYQTSSGQVRERRVTLAALADGRELVKALAPFGAPVIAPRATAVCEYLDALRNDNRHVLPRFTSTDRLGLRSGGIVGPGYSVGDVPTYAGEFGTRFRTGKDASAYPRALAAVLGWGPAAWPLWLDLGLSAAGPFLALVKPSRNPVTWHHGPSGGGKTTAVRFAGGLHLEPEGEPFTLQGSRQTTPKGTLQTLEHMGGFPVLIDETHMSAPEALEAVVYQFANGQSYTRGGRDGTPKHTPALHGVAFLAGEAPPGLRNLGSRNRALMLDVRQHPPLGRLDTPERAEMLREAWQAGAGTLGPRVLERLWDDREAFLRAVNAAERRTVAELEGQGREWVRALVAAEIALAYVLEAAGITAEAPEIVRPALEALSSARATHDPATEAMAALVSLLVASDPETTRRDGETYVNDGVRRARGSTFAREDGDTWLVITRHAAVVEALEPWGGTRAVEMFGKAWADAGWVEPGKRVTTQQKRFGPLGVCPCVVLKAAAFTRGVEE